MTLDPYPEQGDALVSMFQKEADDEVEEKCTDSYCLLVCTLLVERSEIAAIVSNGTRRRLEATDTSSAAAITSFMVRNVRGQRPLHFDLDFESAIGFDGSNDDVVELRRKFKEALGENVFNFYVHSRRGKPHVTFQMYTALTEEEIRKKLESYTEWVVGQQGVTVLHAARSASRTGSSSSSTGLETSQTVIIFGITLVVTVTLIILVRRNRESTLEEKKVVPFDPEVESVVELAVRSQSNNRQEPSYNSGEVSLFHLARAMAMMDSAREANRKMPQK